VWPDAFLLRPATKEKPEEDYLSSDYFEHFSGTAEQILEQCRSACKIVNIKNDDQLAQLNVGKMKEQGDKRKLNIKVLHQGTKSRPSYAGVYGLPSPTQESEALAVAQLIAEFAVNDVFLCKA